MPKASFRNTALLYVPLDWQLDFGERRTQRLLLLHDVSRVDLTGNVDLDATFQDLHLCCQKYVVVSGISEQNAVVTELLPELLKNPFLVTAVAILVNSGRCKLDEATRFAQSR